MFIDTSAVVSILMGEPEATTRRRHRGRETAPHVALGPP